MICREWSVKYFWDEYGEEEYEFDVLKHGAYLSILLSVWIRTDSIGLRVLFHPRSRV